jgi:predicted dehydrogenase
MSTSYNFLLVGAGAMGGNHARVVAAHSRANLVGVVDPREDTGRQVAERFGARWRPTLDDLSGVDAVILAAGTESHTDLAIQILEAGVPLLIEKPVAPSLADTQKIVDLSRSTGVPLQCGLLERYNPAILTAERAIREPVYITARRHSPYTPRIKTGVAWDLLVHDVDLIIHLMGAYPTTTTAALSVFDPRSLTHAEDLAEVQLRFDAGQVAQASAARISQQKIRQITVYELNRMFEIDLLRRTVTIYHFISAEIATDNGRGYRQQSVMEIPELVTSQEPLSAQLDHFIGILDGTVDADAERESILPSHEVIARVKDPAFR